MSNDLGPLPQLRAFSLTGPAHFSLQPGVLVCIQDTKDTGPWNGLATRFAQWTRENKILAVRYGSSGGGALEAYYDLAEAERIRTWLVEQGGLDDSAPAEVKPLSAMMEGYDEDLEKAMESAQKREKPKELILHCPQCQGQHVDQGVWRYQRVHRTHLCEHCGHEWRPFEFPTVGVLTLGPDT